MAVKQVEIPQTVSDRSNSRLLDIMQALKFESNTLKDLDHANIVQYLGYEESPQYLSMYVNSPAGLTCTNLFQFSGIRPWRNHIELFEETWKVQSRSDEVLHKSNSSGAGISSFQRHYTQSILRHHSCNSFSNFSCYTGFESRQHFGRANRHMQNFRFWYFEESRHPSWSSFHRYERDRFLDGS